MALSTQDTSEEPGTRIPPRVWERHRETILSLYEDHSLVEVMAHMQREHNFNATKMAYKKKLGRWKVAKQTNPVHQDSQDNVERQPAEQMDATMIDVGEEPNSAALRLNDGAITSPREPSEMIPFKDEDEVLELMDLHNRLPVSLLEARNSMHEPGANDALCGIFEEYAQNKKLFGMERILSLLDFLLGPHSFLFCSLVLRFCRIACGSGVFSAKHAGMFVAAVDGLLRNGRPVLLEYSDLQETIKCVVYYWLRNWIHMKEVGSIIDRLFSLYAECEKEDSLYRLVPYLELVKQCTLDDRCDVIGLQCMEKMLEGIHQAIKACPGTIKTKFIYKFLEFLWNHQQGPKTFMAQEGLIGLYYLMRDATYHDSAFHATFVACILIQAYWRDVLDPPEREPFISARIDEMERRLSDIISYEYAHEKLKKIQDLLSVVAADARNCQSRIRGAQFDSITDIRARLAELFWNVWCSKATHRPNPTGAASVGITVEYDKVDRIDLNNPGMELVDAPMPRDDVT